MAGSRKRSRRAFKPVEIVVAANDDKAVDATPERLKKGDDWHWKNPAEIDSSEQNIGNVRRFHKLTRLDRWHKAEVITQRQFNAGNTYRVLHHRATTEPRVVAAYGERSTGGETDYGLARNAAQARARSHWRQARAYIDRDMVGFIDRFIIHDRLPDYRGRAHMRTLAQARNALDRLAEFFDKPIDRLPY